MRLIPKTSKDIRDRLFKNLLITFALSVNLTCGFTLMLILKLEIAYLLLIAFVANLLAGMLIKNIGNGILCACISMVLSMILSIIVTSVPLLSEGIILFTVLDVLLRPIIFVAFASIVGVLLGSLIGDYFY